MMKATAKQFKTVYEDEFTDVHEEKNHLVIVETTYGELKSYSIRIYKNDGNPYRRLGNEFHDYHEAYGFCDTYIREHRCKYEVQEVIIEEYTPNQLENVVKLVTLGRYTINETAKAEKRFRDLDARIDDDESHSAAHFFRIVQLF